MRGNFSQIRELQAYFNESIVNLGVAAVERIMKGELEDEFPDDTREVRSDLHYHSRIVRSSCSPIKIRS